MITWHEVLMTTASTGGHWVRVPDNGWGALIAYLAGPGRVRTVARRYNDVRVVTVHDGVRTEHSEEITPEDVRGIERDIASYVAERAAPAPPPGVSFEILIPDELSFDELEHDLLAATMRIASDGDPLAERQALDCVLRKHLSA
ncbi:DUF5956 family protein [Actinotalea fermentans]|uniref:Uncharacterized protein n=1 Tax=Actinotalea fermentans TaxID=43671 RepID=A0A511Z180_9CELL|nr:DUF5956 family protein [Actinotalea fermentans]KGM17254.1 hypothetical protein N867_07460 [Actinotalea fermentans ATCC 43279 = JCM 9966 = DSM 3133]GEN81208.1 hypothetical protein AFE02nite_29420 [Actinotalea fermentans]